MTTQQRLQLEEAIRALKSLHSELGSRLVEIDPLSLKNPGLVIESAVLLSEAGALKAAIGALERV